MRKCSKRTRQTQTKTEVHKRWMAENHTGQHVVKSLTCMYNCIKFTCILLNVFSVRSTETESSFPKLSVSLGNLELYTITRACWMVTLLTYKVNKELICGGTLPFKALKRNTDQWLWRLIVEGAHPTFSYRIQGWVCNGSEGGVINWVYRSKSGDRGLSVDNITIIQDR